MTITNGLTAADFNLQKHRAFDEKLGKEVVIGVAQAVLLRHHEEREPGQFCLYNGQVISRKSISQPDEADTALGAAQLTGEKWSHCYGHSSIPVHSITTAKG